MTNAELQIQVALRLGWRLCWNYNHTRVLTIPPGEEVDSPAKPTDSPIHPTHCLPNYPESRDACSAIFEWFKTTTDEDICRTFTLKVAELLNIHPDDKWTQVYEVYDILFCPPSIICQAFIAVVPAPGKEGV